MSANNSEAARDLVFNEALRIFFGARAAGRSAEFGRHTRFKGRAAEFRLRTDYEVAEALVDAVIRNKSGVIGKDRAVLDRIAIAARAPVPESHFSLDPRALKELVGASLTDPVAWAACVRIAADAIERGIAVPTPLCAWTLDVLRGTVKPPDRRTGAFLAPQNDAIVLAVRLALESGAFATATHSKDKRLDKHGRARSACELVANRMTNAGMGIAVSYGRVADIWREAGFVRVEKK